MKTYLHLYDMIYI